MTRATRPGPTAAESRAGGTRGYDTILVPLDGTPFAEAALRPAAELAARSGGSLHLATALHEKTGEMLHVEDPMPPEHDAPVREVGKLERYLEEVSERLGREWGCTVETHVLGDTTAARVLVAHARDIDADLMVAATHHRGTVLRGLLGSTAADFVRWAPCPILLIPSADPEPDEETPMQGDVRNVAAALDPSGDSDGVVLSHALEWARLWGATVHVVQSVVEVPLPNDASLAMSPAAGVTIDEENVEIVRSRLERIASELRTEGVDVQVSPLLGNRAADAVADYVEAEGVDLVVAGRHDKGFLERVLLGSESGRLMKRLRTVGLLVCPLNGRTSAS